MAEVLNDAAKAVIMLLEDHELSDKSYWDGVTTISVYLNKKILEFCFFDLENSTTIDILIIDGLVDPEDGINTFQLEKWDQIDLIDPQSINIIEEWIKSFKNGYS